MKRFSLVKYAPKNPTYLQDRYNDQKIENSIFSFHGQNLCSDYATDRTSNEKITDFGCRKKGSELNYFFVGSESRLCINEG